MFIYLNKKKIITILFVLLLQTQSIIAEEPPRVITLDDAIEIAISNNHSLVLSKLDVDISTARVREAKSNYYPHFESRIIVPFVERESGFFIDQLIWDFGRTSNLVKATKYELSASEFNVDQKLRETVQDTKILYYKALINKNFVTSAEKNLLKNELIVQKFTELNKSGRSSNIELTRAMSDLGEARLELHRQNNIFLVSKLELIDLIGAEFSKDIELVDDENISFKNYELQNSVSNAVNNSSRLKKVDAELSASRANADASKSEFYPMIFGRTAYRFEGEGGEQFPAFIAGLGFSFPIFEGFSRFARKDIRKAESARSLIEYEKTKKQIRTEVNKIIMDLRFSKERIEITKSNLELASDNLNLINEKYNLETSSKIELLDAELFYAESKSKYLEAIYNYKINETMLQALSGTN